MSISSKIQEYNQRITDRWHTPGHKGMLWGDDITEIADGEVFPSDEIEKAQETAAQVFGAGHVRFLTGGSSMGVKAAILAVDSDIIAPSRSHRSVFEGAALAKRNVFTIENKIENDLPLPLDVQQIEDAILRYPSAKAVVITSPDYFGRVCKADVIATVKKHGKILIADSAHGAHFALRPDLFPPSLSMLADFCNMSAHKTLFSFTMGAYLCINNESLLTAADEALKNLGTTSPLYPLLASLENAVTAGILQKSIYDKLKQYSENFRAKIETAHTDDFTRICVDANKYGTDGKTMYYKLLEKGIAAEMFTQRYVVFIVTTADDEEKFQRLATAIKEV